MGILKSDEGAGDVLEEGRHQCLTLLPDDFFVTKKGRQACLLLYRKVRKEFFDACLIINELKCHMEPALCLRQLGFDVDIGESKFRVPMDRWEALQVKTDRILAARGGRIQARKLSSFTGNMISMKLA